MSTLYKLIPMMLELRELGQKLEREGKIRLRLGGDYSTAALKFVRSEYGLAISS
jgi:hypothetical protein